MADDFLHEDSAGQATNFNRIVSMMRGVLRDDFREDLQTVKHELMATRGPDTEAAVMKVIGVTTPEQLAEYQEMTQAQLRSRKRRTALRGKLVDVADDTFWKSFRWLVWAIVAGGGLTVATHYLPAWLIAMVPKG